jgi:glycine/D-amino acid oxidase-like deaminating enzyme
MELNQAEGCGCWEGVRVEDVEPEGDAFLLRAHTGDRLRSRHAVLATGPWLADEPGQGPPGWGLRVKKVAALHLALRPRPDDPAIVFCGEDAFLLPMPAAGFTLFSFCCDTWDVRPHSAGLLIERHELDAALGVLARRSARLAASHAGGRAFCDGYLPGRLPLVCEDPGRPGVLLAGGCSGSGFRLAPALAELALDRLDRFAEG